jgi:hypothetical protein
MRKTFRSVDIENEKQKTVVLEMVQVALALKPIFDLSCPNEDCRNSFHIDDTNFDLPPERAAKESMDSFWKKVAKDWANNAGFPPIGTIFGNGVSMIKDTIESNEFEVTARGFDIPSQPASDTLMIECLSCGEEHNIKTLEYRHIPGAKGEEELEDVIEEFHGITVWGLNQKLN